MSDYFAAGVIISIGAVLFVLACVYLDSGGIEYDEDNTWEWDDYREAPAGMLGVSGPLEIVDIDGVTYIHAKDTGKGEIMFERGKPERILVEPAVADLILMDGQSNAAYYLKNDIPPEADKAPAPKVGTCWYFGRLTDPKMNYDFGDISDYAIHDFIDPSTGVLRIGDKGPGFCKEYTEATGHKAVWVSLGIIGKRISTWLPPSGTNWTYDQGMMEALNAQLADLPVKIDRTVMMWAQGESDKNAGTSIAAYKEKFMTFYDAIPQAWGYDIDACYLISGKTSNMGDINTALAQLADEHEDIKLAVPASLIDTFSVENGLMYSDDLHYTQEGDNAVANAAARYVLNDMKLSVGTAPIYLMQALTGVVTGGTYNAPTSVTTYSTDGGRGRVSATFTGTVDTSAEGYTVIDGSAVVSPERLLPYVTAVEIVDVFSQIRQGGLVYSVGESATLTGYEGSPTAVNVPATVSRSGLTFDVTAIGTSAFQDCTTITSADLGSVSDVGNGAFYNCTALETVTAPGVLRVGPNGFRGCSSLTAIDLPLATTLQGYAFNNDASLRTVSIPSVTSIEGFVFRLCPATVEVTFGPLTGTVTESAFSAWTFYDADGTTVLAKTPANLANSTFRGTATALVKEATA